MPAVTDYTIIEWAVRFRSSNWAVRTGTIPDLDGRCLVVADVDYPERLNITEHDLFYHVALAPHPYGRQRGPSTSTPTPRPLSSPRPRRNGARSRPRGSTSCSIFRYSWMETPYLETLWPDSFLDTLLPYDGNVHRTDIRVGGHAKRRRFNRC